MILRRGYEFTPGYRLQEYVGKGQFGEVWRASGPGGVTLAAKFIDLTEGSGQREYEAIKRIKSIRQANLMQITGIWQLDEEGNVLPEPPDSAEQTIDLFDADSQSALGFVVNPGPEPATLVVGMLLGDASLENYLPSKKRPDASVAPGDLLRYMEGVARGLDFLNSPKHDFGAGPVSLQHCDIKPANIVLIGDSAVICDFGLARILQRNQATLTQAAGTPAYMSPEAIDGKPSCNSDQYSLAVTYYHLRTGKLPVQDGSVYQVLAAHRSGKIQFDLVPAIEREILQRATHMDWQKRYPSNSEFVDAIRNALTQQGLHQVGEGAGPNRPHKAPTPPKSAPGGAAVAGIDTIDRDDLTDGIVQYSKGGSPIASNNRGANSDEIGSDSVATMGGVLPSHSGTLDFEKALPKSRVPADSDMLPVPGIDGTSDIQSDPGSVNLYDGFAGHAASGTETRQSNRKKALVWQASIATGLGVIAIIAGMSLWDSAPEDESTEETTPLVTSSGRDGDTLGSPTQNTATLISQAIMALPDNLDEAASKFRAAVAGDPKIGRPISAISRAAHAGSIELLLPIQSSDSRARYLTSGDDRDIRNWSVAKSAATEGSPFPTRELESQIWAKLPANLYYRDCVQRSMDGRSLFVATDSQLHQFPIIQSGNLRAHQNQTQASSTLKLRDEILSLAAHPTMPKYVVAGLADQTAVVVSVDDLRSDSKLVVVAETDLTDVASQMAFLSSGSHLLIRLEGGDVVAHDWQALSTNVRTRSASRTISTGIALARTIELQTTPDTRMVDNMSGIFWVGDEEGIVSAYQLNSENKADSNLSAPTVHRVYFDDDSHTTGITVLKSRRVNAARTILVSGSDQGTAGINVLEQVSGANTGSLQRDLGDLVEAQTTQLSLNDGPIRCIGFSADSQWTAIGCDKAVWVVNVLSAERYRCRLPLGSVSVESVVIDSANNALIVGCSDGHLATFNWNHCRLRSLLGSEWEGDYEIREVPVQPQRESVPDQRVTMTRSAEPHVSKNLAL